MNLFSLRKPVLPPWPAILEEEDHHEESTFSHVSTIEENVYLVKNVCLSRSSVHLFSDPTRSGGRMQSDSDDFDLLMGFHAWGAWSMPPLTPADLSLTIHYEAMNDWLSR